MELFCKWVEREDSWVCEQCEATVPRAIVPTRPVSACPKGMKSRGITAQDFVRPHVDAQIPLNQDGPGTELKKLLARIGIKAAPNCSCNQRAAQMNLWGADESEKRLDEIVGWLREEAEKRKLPFIDAAARLLVRRAIANARRKSALTD